MEPAWSFVEFVEACRLDAVFVHPGALKTARSDFKLYSERELLAHIGSGGVEDQRFINRGPWRNNPNPTTPVDQDEYAFFSGLRYGYLAFMYVELTQKWHLKSFKLNQNPDPRNLVFARLLTGRKF